MCLLTVKAHKVERCTLTEENNGFSHQWRPRQAQTLRHPHGNLRLTAQYQYDIFPTSNYSCSVYQ